MGARVRDGQVELWVTDGGRGVPDDLVPRLFDRFATAGETSGTGLGLYLVREIARGHGGEADYLPPAAGRPATFVVRFPAAAAGQ
jgi:signal transduction histidine kinase